MQRRATYAWKMIDWELSRVLLSQAHRIIDMTCKPWNPLGVCLCALDYNSVVEDAVRKSRTCCYCCWSNKMIYGERRPWGSLWLTIFVVGILEMWWEYFKIPVVSLSLQRWSGLSGEHRIHNFVFFNSCRLDWRKRKLNYKEFEILAFNERTSLLVSMWRSLISRRSIAVAVG